MMPTESSERIQTFAADAPTPCPVTPGPLHLTESRCNPIAPHRGPGRQRRNQECSSNRWSPIAHSIPKHDLRPASLLPHPPPSRGPLADPRPDPRLHPPQPRAVRCHRPASLRIRPHLFDGTLFTHLPRLSRRNVQREELIPTAAERTVSTAWSRREITKPPHPPQCPAQAVHPPSPSCDQTRPGPGDHG